MRAPPTPAVPAVPTPLGPEGFGPGIAEALTAFNSAGVDIIPYTCNVELNSYRMADTTRISLPLERLPFDPRIIRSATVQIFGGTYTEQEFAEANGPVGAQGLLLSDIVQPGPRTDVGQSNELFRGFVDDWEISLTGRDTLDITARDLTGPLLDAELPENALRDLPNILPLDQVIQLLLTGDGGPTPVTSRRFGLPGFRGIVVVNEVAAPGSTPDLLIEEPLPILKDIRPPMWYSSKKMATKGRRNPADPGQRITYWDAITDLVTSAGLIVYMRPGKIPIQVPSVGSVLPASEVVITNPQTYYIESRTTGFAFSNLSTQRQLVYGRNVEEMTIKRKLGGVKTPTIEVRSFDPVTGIRLFGRYPPLPTNTQPALGTAGAGDREEIKVFVLDEISGPLAQLQLVATARSIYEQLGRGEITVNLRTKHMAGLEQNIDSGVVGDLLRLRPGDPITIEVEPADVEAGRVAAHTLFTAATINERIISMVAKGLPEEIATLAATAMNNPFIQQEFRTSKNTMNFAHDQGWDFQIHAINYLDVRNATSTIDGLPPLPGAPS